MIETTAPHPETIALFKRAREAMRASVGQWPDDRSHRYHLLAWHFIRGKSFRGAEARHNVGRNGAEVNLPDVATLWRTLVRLGAMVGEPSPSARGHQSSPLTGMQPTAAEIVRLKGWLSEPMLPKPPAAPKVHVTWDGAAREYVAKYGLAYAERAGNPVDALAKVRARMKADAADGGVTLCSKPESDPPDGTWGDDSTWTEEAAEQPRDPSTPKFTHGLHEQAEGRMVRVLGEARLAVVHDGKPYFEPGTAAPFAVTTEPRPEVIAVDGSAAAPYEAQLGAVREQMERVLLGEAGVLAVPRSADIQFLTPGEPPMPLGNGPVVAGE